MTKIAINGLGRIGRPVLRRILNKHPELDVVAINDLTEPKTLAHLLKFDSLYRSYNKTIKVDQNELLIDGTSRGKKIKVFQEKDPLNLPWQELKVDVVLECSGVFTDYQGAKKHLEAGAKKVLISAPSKDSDKISSYVLGINKEKFDPEKDEIVDMASCTTNCLAPVAKVLNDNYGIIKGFMTTIHSYTNDQRILDFAHKDLRRARAAAINIIPTTTGAAKAIGNVIPELKGKLDGIALRVPTPTVSVVDLVCLTEKETTKEEVNLALKKASQEDNFKGILGVEDAPLVSSDYIGNSFSSVVDSSLTMVQGNLVKIIAWYDNEWAYACRLAEFAEYIGKKI
jgi:glyceraldehyde 3-phosphate dehydrogenase